MDSNLDETLQLVSSSAKQADPNFKKVIDEKNHNDSYEVTRAFKNALKHCTFWGTIIIGFSLVFLVAFAIWRFGEIFFAYTTNTAADPNKSTVFMSHVWTFTFGALTSLAALLTRSRK